jgi:hypothetical protein
VRTGAMAPVLPVAGTTPSKSLVKPAFGPQPGAAKRVATAKATLATVTAPAKPSSRQ